MRLCNVPSLPVRIIGLSVLMSDDNDSVDLPCGNCKLTPRLCPPFGRSVKLGALGRGRFLARPPKYGIS